MQQKLIEANTRRTIAYRKAVEARQERQKAAFLTAFAAAPSGRDAVAVAAAAAGVARTTPYRWRARDPTFAACWREITLSQYESLLERVAADLQRRQDARERRKAELRPAFQQLAAGARAAKRRR